MTEVRALFDKMVILFPIGVLLLFALPDISALRRSALGGLMLILSGTLALPFFGFFWRHIFHALLFDNTDWLNTKLDISYYIMPRVFFLHTVILVIAVTAVVNLLLYLVLRYLNRRQEVPERQKLTKKTDFRPL